MGRLSFVTGANGFLGSHLVDALLARGDEVTCLVRRTSDLRWIEGKDLHLVYGDVSDNSWKRSLERQNLVFHSAGIIKSRSAEEFWRVNAEGTRHMVDASLSACRALERFVLISSIAASGPACRKSGMRESDECRPVSNYGKSKRGGEEFLEGRSDIPYTVIRPAAIYGPRDEQILSLFRLVNIGFYPVIGFDDRHLNLVHVSDVVSCILAASESKSAVCKTFNAGGGENPSYKEIGKGLARALGKRIAIPIVLPDVGIKTFSLISEGISLLTRSVPLFPWDKSREACQKSWAVDLGKSRETIGYRPRYSLEDGLKETASWYRGQGLL